MSFSSLIFSSAASCHLGATVGVLLTVHLQTAADNKLHGVALLSLPSSLLLGLHQLKGCGRDPYLSATAGDGSTTWRVSEAPCGSPAAPFYHSGAAFSISSTKKTESPVFTQPEKPIQKNTRVCVDVGEKLGSKTNQQPKSLTSISVKRSGPSYTVPSTNEMWGDGSGH